jgi:AraC family transcriptional regulator
MQVEIKNMPELRVAAVRQVGAYDPKTAPLDELRSDAGVVVPAGAPLPEGLAEPRLAAGRYACALHVGPHEKLGDA